MTPFTATEYEMIARASLAAQNDNPEEWEDEYIDEDTSYLIQTAESLEDFSASSASWVEKESVKSGTYGGFNYLYWSSHQMNVGERRERLLVLDLGESRAALSW